MKYLPIAIKLKNKNVIVAGAGEVAERKIETLIRAGAKIHIVSPSATDKVKRLVKIKRIKWTKRKARRSDLNQAKLIIAATNDRRTNERISRWAHQEEILINVVDKPILSDFISPAIIHSKGAILAVYTDGKDPVLSRDLKNYLKEHWNDFLSYRHRLLNKLSLRS